MRLLRSIGSLAAQCFRRSQIQNDVEEELRSHIQHRADDLERSGLNRADAERRARIEFGADVRFKEECYEALGGQFFDILLKDMRFSIRLLRKSPGFTIIAVVTLALAIAANAVVFAVFKAAILHPLNLPDSKSLYAVQRGKAFSTTHSYPDYIDLRDRNRSFDGMAAYNIDMAGLDTGAGDPSRAWVVEASGNYFDVLGIQPYLGRFFHSADEHGPNSAPFVVLSYAYWHSRFADDPEVVGRKVQINKHPFTVIGVAPPGFRGTLMFLSPDLFLPIVNVDQVRGINALGADLLNSRGTRWLFMVLGRLKPGVTPAQAVADLNSIGSYLEKTFPITDGQMTFSLARPGLSGDALGRPIEGFVTGLMLLAGLILLAACANLGSLFAARIADRSRDVALRLALGASRNRVLRQLLTEAVLISAMGGALGLWGSNMLLRRMSVWQPLPRFPLHIPVQPDPVVYAMALVLALGCGLLFGLVPLRQLHTTDPYQMLKSGSYGKTGRRTTPRDLLLAVQIAICAVLVTSSVVAVRGLLRSLHSNFGFEPRNAILLNTNLDMAGYRDDAVRAMQTRMIDAMQTISGVSSVALVDRPPLLGDWVTADVFTDETADFRPSNAAAVPVLYSVSPEYFRAAGTALLSGRSFSWHDDKSVPQVAVVNREFARKVFGRVPNALNRYFKRRDGTRFQVVGIVEDGKYKNLTEDPQAAMFLPILQRPSSETWMVIRSNGDAQQLAAAIRRKLRDLDRALPFYIQTWTKGLDLVLFPSLVATVSLGVLGLMGAMLSITGIFGMAAYSVSKRLREFGIRIALGARRKQVLEAALGRAFKLLTFGSAAGLIVGVLASRVLALIVYLATPRDPVVLSVVVLAMLLLGLLATWIPAQRALSVDPARLLREE